jgi:hormone-sensitive lipase
LDDLTTKTGKVRLGTRGFYDPETEVQVRLIAKNTIFADMDTRPFSVNPTAKKIDTALIHIHGGGFIGSTTLSHVTYTCRWANAFENVAVFSVDYRLAPQCRFPAAIDDCWQAYVWIVRHSREVLNLDFKRIVIAGDSAGGSLAYAITVMAIERGFRVPDALMPCYPTSMQSFEAFWPSMLAAVDEPILSCGFTILAWKAY